MSLAITVEWFWQCMALAFLPSICLSAFLFWFVTSFLNSSQHPVTYFTTFELDPWEQTCLSSFQSLTTLWAEAQVWRSFLHEELHPPKVKEVPDPRDLVYCQNKNSSLCVQSAVLELELVEWTMKDLEIYSWKLKASNNWFSSGPISLIKNEVEMTRSLKIKPY